MKPIDFFTQYSEAAISACQGTPFFPSVLIAQAAVESAWGESSLSKTYNNFFGIIPGSTWNGETINLYSAHDASLGLAPRRDYRVYGSPEECFADRNKVLMASRYAEAQAATTPEDQAIGIESGGWAGVDNNYAATIMTIVNEHNLTNLDKKKR